MASGAAAAGVCVCERACRVVGRRGRKEEQGGGGKRKVGEDEEEKKDLQ